MRNQPQDKKNSWVSFCEEIDDVRAASKLRKILNKNSKTSKRKQKAAMTWEVF